MGGRRRTNVTTDDVEARHGEVVARVLLAAKAVVDADAAVRMSDPFDDDRALEERDEALDELDAVLGAYELLHGALPARERLSS
jgi:hypothetical protein